mmetsp:Transcript_8716/g.35526  ORF Transcript_8716/g.35526 Transcript_8716/m.35526 type:complete len:334 (-) Transcript_8716:3393-4394(-)
MSGRRATTPASCPVPPSAHERRKTAHAALRQLNEARSRTAPRAKVTSSSTEITAPPALGSRRPFSSSSLLDSAAASSPKASSAAASLVTRSDHAIAFNMSVASAESPASPLSSKRIPTPGPATSLFHAAGEQFAARVSPESDSSSMSSSQYVSAAPAALELDSARAASPRCLRMASAATATSLGAPGIPRRRYSRAGSADVGASAAADKNTPLHAGRSGETSRAPEKDAARRSFASASSAQQLATARSESSLTICLSALPMSASTLGRAKHGRCGAGTGCTLWCRRLSIISTCFSQSAATSASSACIKAGSTSRALTSQSLASWVSSTGAQCL